MTAILLLLGACFVALPAYALGRAHECYAWIGRQQDGPDDHPALRRVTPRTACKDPVIGYHTRLLAQTGQSRLDTESMRN